MREEKDGVIYIHIYIYIKYLNKYGERFLNFIKNINTHILRST